MVHQKGHPQQAILSELFGLSQA